MTITSRLTATSDPSDQAAALRALEEFVHRLFVFEIPRNFFIQMGVIGIFLLISFMLGASVVIHRLIQGKFWLFKLMRKSDGTYVVPNAFNNFLIFKGIFTIIWILLTIAIYLCYDRRFGHLQHNIVILSAGTWIPLIFGATFCGWGTFYAAPGALEGDFVTQRNSLWRNLKPYLINTIAFGSPVLLIASTLAPASVAQRKLSHAFDDYQSWSAQTLTLANASAALPQQDLDNLLSRASGIWDVQANAFGLLGVTYLIWSVWTGIFTLFYALGAGWLVLVLFRELRTQHRLLNAMQKKHQQDEKRQKQEALREKWRTSSVITPASPTLVNPDWRPLPAPGQGTDSLLFALLSEGTKAADPTDLENPMDQAPSRPWSPKEVFFPRLQKEARKRATRRITSTDTPFARFHHMRRCFLSLAILYFGVLCGATLYLVITSRLGSQMFSAALQGPTATTRLIYSSYLPAAWGACVFGLLTIGSIFVRDLDPASAPRLSCDRRKQGNAHEPAQNDSERAGQHRRSNIFIAGFAKYNSTSMGSDIHRNGSSNIRKLCSQRDTVTSRTGAPTSDSCTSPPPPLTPIIPRSSDEQGMRWDGSQVLSLSPRRSREAQSVGSSRQIRLRKETLTRVDNTAGMIVCSSAMPEMAEHRGSTSTVRRKTVYSPIPFGPIRAPARLDVRLWVLERSPPPVPPYIPSMAEPRQSLGDLHSGVVYAGEDNFESSTSSFLPSITASTSVTKHLQPFRAASLTSLSSAEPSSPESINNLLRDGTTPRRSKTSTWVLRELADMDRARATMGLEPLPRRSSRAGTSSLVSAAEGNPCASSLLEGIAPRRMAFAKMRSQPHLSADIGEHVLGATTTASSSLEIPRASLRRASDQWLRPVSQALSPQFKGWNILHDYSLASPFIQTSSFNAADEDADQRPLTPLSPRLKRPRLPSIYGSPVLGARHVSKADREATRSRPPTVH
ncbi:hypothetical protein K437DRAFT_256140 [Tilletiaria anomala UBC 951]|uniref:Uncharacterized protein n=1 Tax=Tilletiaria anomala (strain ATCC 24038 / CBS 436.72 / UBC 951) TaxID=1037660 RepID=A0A066W247_TILAU|nr:uncharacterized protein K437DRAFT_256140 [Tilletiaria anomala UBC 951]KDN46633.1 hypothetical protein K437DRAFT_256140 [Tilletiaria anomala UBC 951]